MRLKKAKNCNSCHAYEERNEGRTRGYCGLGFETTPLYGNEATVGRRSYGWFWLHHCKPTEPCLKPMSLSQLVEANKQVRG